MPTTPHTGNYFILGSRTQVNAWLTEQQLTGTVLYDYQEAGQDYLGVSIQND
jgi:hypothetical protein